MFVIAAPLTVPYPQHASFIPEPWHSVSELSVKHNYESAIHMYETWTPPPGAPPASELSLIYWELESLVAADWQVFLIVFPASLSYQRAQQLVAETAVQSDD